jgi:hypothetical protein
VRCPNSSCCTPMHQPVSEALTQVC